MNAAILLATAFASASCPLAAQKANDLSGILKAKGMPAFVARSAEVRGDLIVCKDLDLVGPAAGEPDKKFRGRVLFYCEPRDALWLWVAHSNQQMRRAAPFVGLEKPGVKFADLSPQTFPAPAELVRPARLFVVTVDEDGRIVRNANIIVRKLQETD